MKTVFKSDEIAHVWAHQTQEHGRAVSNMSFSGPRFYSYYTCVAEIVTHPRTGEKAFILIRENYSQASSKHQTAAWEAARGNGPIFWHPYQQRGSDSIVSTGENGFKETGKRIFEYALNNAAKSQAKAKTARTRAAFYAEESARHLQEAEEANQFFMLRRKVDQSAIARLQADAEKARKKYQKEIREAQKRAEEARAEQREKTAAAFEQWKQGHAVSYFHNFYEFETALRIDPKDPETVETSKGARVPTADVKRAFYFIMRHRAGWRKNGETFQIGGYQLDAVNDAGIVAGCHVIKWPEVYRFAAVLGLKTPDEQTEEKRGPFQIFTGTVQGYISARWEEANETREGFPSLLVHYGSAQYDRDLPVISEHTRRIMQSACDALNADFKPEQWQGISREEGNARIEKALKDAEQ